MGVKKIRGFIKWKIEESFRKLNDSGYILPVTSEVKGSLVPALDFVSKS